MARFAVPETRGSALPELGRALTRNLFEGTGEGQHLLSVVEGQWPQDVCGQVYILGPDRRAPGGHWFAGQGLLMKIGMTPEQGGHIAVRMRRVNTPMNRLRARFPGRFRMVRDLLEASPLGFTNFANTNVQSFGGRLFVGYDVGRPVEVDPETLAYLGPVGALDEWVPSLPGLVDPLFMVAAHPAPDHVERALYFVNYRQLVPGRGAEVYLVRWDLQGALRRVRLVGPREFDSIHDVRATRDHLVFSDLPFVTVSPGAQPRPMQDFTRLWIVRKKDLRAAGHGGEVVARELKIPISTGHLTVDYEEGGDGSLTVVLQHMIATDLASALGPEDRRALDGQPFDEAYHGLPRFGPQPAVIGRYRIDPVAGRVLEKELAYSRDGIWGPLLATFDDHSASARSGGIRSIFQCGLGAPGELLSAAFARSHRESGQLLVPLEECPDGAARSGLQRVDLTRMEVADMYRYADGSIAQPPTFVPRVGSGHELDGYVLVLVHRDGAKGLDIFDAGDLQKGPIARATAPGFRPALPLHSCWMAPPDKDRKPIGAGYRVSPVRDLLGLLRGLPGQMASFGRGLLQESARRRRAPRGAHTG